MPEGRDKVQDTRYKGTALGLDFGQRRIGVAVGSAGSGGGTPLGAVSNRGNQPDWAALDRLVAEWRPDALVVGKPFNLDGSDHGLTPLIDRFCERLSDRYKLPVARVDERLSSREAAERLRDARQSGRRGRRVRKEDVDAMSAVILLETWFSESP
ncbi:Holliday junction resolvase RuvX [Thioalkalivibrio denitrificans]|uniref:Putative pre-16S rRNA nuclease n=1 Tax=Thioalkalivibrio denitrificans TaxID=108003 RepID=A0A1V3NV66_9GAMM|nr:Holliday junction resolvase RuvX [Thioalkalivibrio denitrificans]OOG28616.1 Holliday junction resolvase RuvX [Thioalkalivibrio denitrificans]